MFLSGFLRPRLRSALLLGVLLLPVAALSDATRVLYPANQTAHDNRFNDLIEILDTALKATVAEWGPYELAPSRNGMNEARYLAELKEGRNTVNVVWSSTSVEKEHDLLPLRIPLRKGILGYRIALIAKEKQALIDQIKTLDDLKKLKIGQGIGWGDVQLYESNGLAVTTSQYDNLFRMAAGGRFDLFPRGISEAFHEYDTYSKDNPNLAIEQNLLIYYPWPYYFFFHKSDTPLKERIEAGIRKMMKDGTFDAIFQKYNGAAIEKANLKHRRIIRVENKLLPKETPLNDASLWFDPKR
ncbi:MAG: substrate-binding periplasmic protein [Rhodoferax sp.]